ncbi:MAG: HisA/HisF-related TIM barrel protein, partial [Candidatus Omnitrophica bacterium]|nr:HisA/HisF-related TIM barrel protein [Candidatus Omnitrophota bacterium]
NIGIVKQLIETLHIKVELGGGLRTITAIQRALDIGVDRAVLGTAVLKDKAFAKECVDRFGDKVVFGIDVKDGTVRVDGWTKDTGRPLGDVIAYFESIGLKRIIYTDISRDGMMEGPNLKGLESVAGSTALEIISSGGVSRLDDIVRIRGLKKNNIKGIIIGKALYEGTIKLEEALRVS